MTVRIAIADDHPVVLAGLASFLAGQRDFEVVAQQSGVSDPAGFVAIGADVAVLDVRMPGTTPELVAALDEAGTRVVLFTRSASGAGVDALVPVGVHGVVSKEVDLGVLVEAVHAVAAGGRYLPDARVAPHHGLSGRERAVFDALIASKRPKEIAYDLGLSLSTVYTYAERVRKKPGVEDVRDVVSYAHREGLIETED